MEEVIKSYKTIVLLGVRKKNVPQIILLALLNIGCVAILRGQENLKLWYNEPAAQWKESLPIGNGRIGTMIAGNVERDTLVINEETVWTGGIHDYINPEAKGHLKEIRQLILDKKYDEALQVGDQYMIGKPKKLQSYQPLGKLEFNFPHKGNITDYKRSLSLNEAIVNISFKENGELYTREYLASFPDDVVVMRFYTESDQGLHFDLQHTSRHESSGSLKGDTYILKGKGSKGGGIEPDIQFESRIEILGDGSFALNPDGSLRVTGGQEVVLLYTAATNYKKYNDVSANPEELCEAILSKLRHQDYPDLLRKHVDDYSGLYNRLQVDFGLGEFSDVPTNELIDRFVQGERIPVIDELFYQMSRYLIISGSRKKSQPLNLQGIWNDNMQPAWGSKWTLNINLPMNYWMVESANLAECHEPLFELLYDLRETGAKVAREHYGCRGFVAHHNTDLWRAATPVDGATWGLWTFGGAWLTRHLWESYQYSQNKEFLKKVYPIMKEASLFFFDFLSEGNDGYLVTSPSVSFEQSYRLPNGKEGRLAEGPTMDNQILRDLFGNCLRAGEILNDDKVYRDSLVLMTKKLRPSTINQETGELMEWAWSAEPRNISGQLAPLWGVNPGTEINYSDSPELAMAAEKTIKARDPFVASYETTGSWVSGTKANFWARLNKGDEAYYIIKRSFIENLFPNMLVSFYPEKYFQIDGNLGMAAAMNEMLLQSHRINDVGQNIIEILPALPLVWKDGSIQGIRARGGFELSMAWKDGKLRAVKILSKKGNTCNLVYGDKSIELETEAGQSYLLDRELNIKTKK
ncbi:alpha-L-fucosidase 2 [Zobellia uliginosa]|uniref:Alpha-L-fucosidase 2 n=1 Tax=Zobellia uliginosa TaxID=143224 RepID=A0ABY1L520_9FLAO|nr:glycoside hydrolase family 95 protein [Zobellia uliginosa]SIT02757.1 alpha-L-fucosidase 2 [Zobellia uliginosa]